MTSSFITTYRNDFLWPFVRTAPLRPGCQGVRYSTVPSPEQALERGSPWRNTSACWRLATAARRRRRLPGVALRPTWSSYSGCQHHRGAARVLPTTRPSDSPQRPGAAEPQVAPRETPLPVQHDPVLPPDDLVSRVFKDRYRSVYQVDFGKQGEYPNSEYDALVAGSGLAGSAPGALPYCPCRSAKFSSDGSRMAVVSLDRNRQLQACEQAQRAEATRSSDGDIEVCLCGLVPKKPQFGRRCSISCRPKTYGRNRREGTSERGEATVNRYRTEYRDSYSKLGSLIMAENIHCANRLRRPGPYLHNALTY